MEISVNAVLTAEVELNVGGAGCDAGGVCVGGWAGGEGFETGPHVGGCAGGDGCRPGGEVGGRPGFPPVGALVGCPGPVGPPVGACVPPGPPGPLGDVEAVCPVELEPVDTDVGLAADPVAVVVGSPEADTDGDGVPAEDGSTPTTAADGSPPGVSGANRCGAPSRIGEVDAASPVCRIPGPTKANAAIAAVDRLPIAIGAGRSGLKGLRPCRCRAL
ncbi:hypothetical protein GCM10009839_76810 [Catenulispora yoronensis]|uniref:Uncharacterized protein n=1 Tax=Catenulispora yoronensis TaxID=450799 RepID=A0ABN2VCC8_9ACTN